MPDLYPPRPPWDGVERRKQPPVSVVGGRRVDDFPEALTGRPGARSRSYMTVSRRQLAGLATGWGILGGVLGSLVTSALMGVI